MQFIHDHRHYYSPTDKSQILTKHIKLQCFDRQVAEADLISFSHVIALFAEEIGSLTKEG